MKHAPGLWHIMLVFVLLITLVQPTEPLLPIWDTRLAARIHVRQHYNPRRNRQRWLRRWTKRRRQQPRPRCVTRRRRRARIVGQVLNTGPTPIPGGQRKPQPSSTSPPVTTTTPKPSLMTDTAAGADPLAQLRQARGWIDHIEERELWAMLIRVRWPYGPKCPDCGEEDPQYLKLIDADYRGGLGRWQCQVCAEAGDPNEGGTFTPLTGTIFDGMRVDVRTLWLMVESFADGEASVETSDEAGVNRHTTDRLFRLLRAAIYQTRSSEPIVLAPEDVAEFDEVYITAGLKGGAGGWELEREPRKRGLKRRGRGTWDSDRLPVLGLLRRGGDIRLFVLRNVQTDTIRPIVHQMVRRGAHVYTDNYCIYPILSG